MSGFMWVNSPILSLELIDCSQSLDCVGGLCSRLDRATSIDGDDRVKSIDFAAKAQGVSDDAKPFSAVGNSALS